MPLRSDFLPVAPPSDRAFGCLGNTPVCENRLGNPPAGLRRGDKSFLAHSCVVPPNARSFPLGKHSGSSPDDREMRSVVTGWAGWLRAAHFHTAWSPENRSLAWPSFRYSLACCSRYQPPSVAAFS